MRIVKVSLVVLISILVVLGALYIHLRYAPCLGYAPLEKEWTARALAQRNLPDPRPVEEDDWYPSLDRTDAPFIEVKETRAGGYWSLWGAMVDSVEVGGVSYNLYLRKSSCHYFDLSFPINDSLNYQMSFADVLVIKEERNSRTVVNQQSLGRVDAQHTVGFETSSDGNSVQVVRDPHMHPQILWTAP